MTMRQWLCGKLLGHDWVTERHDNVLKIKRDCGELVTIEFKVCTKCGLESDEFEEVNHE